MVGARWRVPVWRQLSLAPRASVGLVSARNSRIDAVALRLPLALSVAWWAETWFVGTVLGYAPTLATHVRHRAASKAAFEDRYPGGGEAGPRHGWYRARSHVLRAGLEGGGLIRGRVSLFGGAGFGSPVGGLTLVSFPDVGRLPFFVHAGVGVALGARREG